MNNSTQSINVQVQSFGKYLRDIWIIALIFVLIQDQTTIGLPFVWIGLQLIIAIMSLLIFRKTGPNQIMAFFIPTFVLLALFFFGSPFWLFVLGVGMSIWRIQARFNTQQNEQYIDSGFTILFYFLFLLVHLFCFLLGYEGYHFYLYSLFVMGIVVFGGIRVFSVLMSVNKHNTLAKTKIVGIYLIGIVAVTSMSVLVYFVAPTIRKMMDVLFGAIMSVVIIPFRPLIDYLEKFLNNLDIKEKEESIRVPFGEQVEIEDIEPISGNVFTSFPFEWLLLGLAIIIVIFFIGFLLKNKPENLEESLVNIEYENGEINVEDEKQKSQSTSFYKVETSLLREKYGQFEVEAASFDLERNRSETVREWFNRMNWEVDNNFFLIYEEVRYGGYTIESQKAELFINTLDETRRKYFIEKDV